MMDEDEWDPDLYGSTASYVPQDFGTSLLELVPSPRTGLRILDLGCGDGVLTEQLRKDGAHVIGVDASPKMVAAAVKRFHDLTVLEMDGHNLTFDPESFDVVFSNAALHWMKKDPDRVLENVARVLKKNGGTFIAECGGSKECIREILSVITTVLLRHGVENMETLNPFYFPEPADHKAKLERAGFTVKQLKLYPRPTVHSTGMKGWMKTFGTSFLTPFSPEEKEAVLTEMEDVARKTSLIAANGDFVADYMTLRFVAVVE